MLMPYINRKNNYEMFKKLFDLNQIICDIDINELSKEFLKFPRNETLKKYLSFSNYSVGLINEDDSENKILKLFDDSGQKIIYNVIHHHFVSICFP